MSFFLSTNIFQSKLLSCWIGRIVVSAILNSLQRCNCATSQRSFEYFVRLIGSIENINGGTIAVLIYPFCIGNTGTDTAMGSRASKLKICTNRQIIAVCLAACNRVDENSALTSTIYMSTILSPGRSHKRLPSAVSCQFISACRSICSRIAY